MQVLSLSEAKMKLSSLVESVNATDEEVMITKNGKLAAVLISPEEFSSWKETIEIKSNLELMNEITQGLEDLSKNTTSLYTLDELLQ